MRAWRCFRVGPDGGWDRTVDDPAVVLGEAAPRLPNTLCVADRGAPSELQVMTLDLEGIMVSAGSACSPPQRPIARTIVARGDKPLAGEAGATVAARAAKART